MQYKILLVLPFFEYLSSVPFWLGAVFLNQVWHPVGFDTCPRETGSVPKTKFQSSRVGISRLFRPVRLEDWNLWGADFLSSSLLEESKVSQSGRTVEVFGFGGFLSLLRVFHWGMFPLGLS